MAQFVEAEVYQACRLLFGPELQLNHEFLRYLQPKGAKSAYRKRAKEHHPDRFCQQNRHIHRQQVRQFQDINRAYDLIIDFLNHRHANRLPLDERTPVTKPAAQPRRQPTPRHNRPASNTSAKRRPYYHGECYAGPLPQRRLEFGLYLYYRQLISFKQLQNAIRWQRDQRPNLGALAVRWGWMTVQQINQVIRFRPNNGRYQRFGERAVALQLIDQRQLKTLLFYQRSLQQRLGEYFIEQGLFSRLEIDRLLREQDLHNRQFPLSGISA